MKKNEILSFLEEHREEIRHKFGVTKLGLFGSYARNEEKPNSDIDIAIELESQNSFRSFFSLLYFLENGLKNKVDLGIEHSLKPVVKKQILKEMIYVE